MTDEEVEALLGKADAALEADDNDEAIRLYTEAASIDPGDGWVYWRRAIAWQAKGDFDREIDDLSQRIRLAPDDGYAYQSRGSAYEEKGTMIKQSQTSANKSNLILIAQVATTTEVLPICTKATMTGQSRTATRL